MSLQPVLWNRKNLLSLSQKSPGTLHEKRCTPFGEIAPVVGVFPETHGSAESVKERPIQNMCVDKEFLKRDSQTIVASLPIAH